MRLRTRAAPAALALALAACGEHPPVETVQTGFRGTGMEQVYNPRVLKEKFDSTAAAIPQDIPPIPQAAPGQVAASQQPAGPSPWKNVQVLNDISPGELTRTMVAMTQWVSPQQGCNYCHVVRDGVTDFASDSIYTKVVSRQMLRMTREINGQWRNHVANTGVTCYTCHGGQPVPKNVWTFTDRNQPLRHYLDRQDLRVQSASMTPSNANRSSIKQTEYTYALMISMSQALGVNCTYCHNSPRWGSWEESTPQRLTALRGIRMVRELNNAYLLPLLLLQGEMRNVGVNRFGRNARRMLAIDEPALDWTAMARGMGVEAARAETAEEFTRLFRSALGQRGPFLIEAVVSNATA